VFDQWCTAIVELAEQTLSGGPDEEAFARLSAYVQLIAANTAADTDRRGCLMAKGAAELAQHDPMVAARSAETMAALLALSPQAAVTDSGREERCAPGGEERSRSERLKSR
jgi:hypothetical protein